MSSPAVPQRQAAPPPRPGKPAGTTAQTPGGLLLRHLKFILIKLVQLCYPEISITSDQNAEKCNKVI